MENKRPFSDISGSKEVQTKKMKQSTLFKFVKINSQNNTPLNNNINSDVGDVSSSEDIVKPNISSLDSCIGSLDEKEITSSTMHSDSNCNDEASAPSTSFSSQNLSEAETPDLLIHLESLGTPIDELKSTPQCASKLPKLCYQNDRTVLFKVSDCFATYPDPWPDVFRNDWSDDYVKMPCSPNNVFRSPGGEIQSRWAFIKQTFSNVKIDSTFKLQEAILSYNKKQIPYWNFSGLHKLFERLDACDSAQFFDETLPGIIRLALKVDKLCTQPIPLLKQDMQHTIVLSQMQIASLLANAFLCTFPKRCYAPKGSLYFTFPYINFNGLFAQYKKEKRNVVVMEKLKFIINYFRRVTTKDPCGTVSFTRQSVTHFPSWKNSKEPLSKFHITSVGKIEDCKGMLQVDFANKYLGGGVLRQGAVQEEIRFVESPELIVGQLFSECLNENECIIIKGIERFNKYIGYGDDLKWDGDYVDFTQRDEWGRRYSAIVAMDAIKYMGKKAKMEQYDSKFLIREVNKAYCSFCSNTPAANLEAISTGNWGCGAFGGDPRLKALLQLIAASKAGRDLVYSTFKDQKLCSEIYHMFSYLSNKKINIGELWQVLEEYSTMKEKISLYEFIYHRFDAYSGDTE